MFIIGQLGLQVIFHALQFEIQIAVAALNHARPRFLVYPRNDELGKVEHALQVARRDVQQKAEPAGHTFDVPDMADRRGQLDVPHALAAHAAGQHFDAALIALDALVAHTLVFAAVALPVLRGTENFLTEQSITFGPQRPVVDCFWLQDFPV